LVTLKKIDVISPARAVGFSQDGSSILLNNGRSIAASAVILATGFDSSWSKIFSGESDHQIRNIPQTELGQSKLQKLLASIGTHPQVMQSILGIIPRSMELQE